MAPLLGLVLEKAAELAGKAIAAGVDFVGRKLGEPEPKGQPLPFTALEHQRAQERAATSHKVKPK